MPESAIPQILLTQTVLKGGCAAKLPAGKLRELLKGISQPRPYELAVGTETLDDACLWDLGDGRFLVQTLDFFTPMVDDAFDFGAIAAANALSDVYAMGGSPKIALTILAFPSATLPMELIAPLMAGASAKISEAGACIAGGHTIDDETLKLGFAVTGFVDKKAAWTNSGARPGDLLLLTKGLGTGTITSAIKTGKAEPDWVGAALKSMTTLNKVGDLLQGLKVNAATDITGFGLAGHAMQMAEASKATLSIFGDKLPAIHGAIEALKMNILNRAHHTNKDYVTAKTSYAKTLSAEQNWLTVDPQTSGGLLLAIPEGQADSALERLKERFPATAIIGTVSSYQGQGSNDWLRFL